MQSIQSMVSSGLPMNQHSVQPQKRLSEFVFCVDEFGLPKNVNVLKTSKLTQLRVYKESLA